MIRRQANCFHPQKLAGVLVGHGFEPPSTFHSVLGIAHKTFNKKMRGESQWTRAQLLFMKSYFKMTPELFCDIFYDTSKVEDKVSIRMFERMEELGL